MQFSALRVTDDGGLDRCSLQVNNGDDPIAALRLIKEIYATSEDPLQKLTIDPGSEFVDPGKKKASLDRFAERELAHVLLLKQAIIKGRDRKI